MDGVTLQQNYKLYPDADDRWIITRAVHQVIFLIDYALHRIREICSCIFGSPELAYQYCPEEEFRSLGGQIDPMRRFDLSREHVDGEILNIPSDARVYPVCVAGRNRSQITKHVLDQKRCANVEKPHGAILGIDVLDENDDHELVTMISSMPVCGCQDDLGRLGVLRRTTRAGEEETSAMDKYQRRKWLDENYFRRIIQGKSIVITYKESFAPIVARLVEVAKKYGLGLQNVHLAPMDSPDPYYNYSVPQFVNCLDRLLQIYRS